MKTRRSCTSTLHMHGVVYTCAVVHGVVRSRGVQCKRLHNGGSLGPDSCVVGYSYTSIPPRDSLASAAPSLHRCRCNISKLHPSLQATSAAVCFIVLHTPAGACPTPYSAPVPHWRSTVQTSANCTSEPDRGGSGEGGVHQSGDSGAVPYHHEWATPRRTVGADT